MSPNMMFVVVWATLMVSILGTIQSFLNSL